MKTILVAVAKNEGPYLREWALYHKKICGFDKVFVYNNDSTDNSEEELKLLSEQGLCDWQDWPRASHSPPQQKAYINALGRFRQECDWLCFMDIDEFLVLNAYEDIKDCVSQFGEDVGSISFNWLMFYSTDERRSPDPVIKRVNYCYSNSHVKTIARTKAANRIGIHVLSLLPGYKYMHASGKEYKLDDNMKTSLDGAICTKKEYSICDTEKAHINHYQMKSKEEVMERDARGRATVSEYIKKNTINHYNHRVKMIQKTTNDNIKKFIERRYGLERFYQDSLGVEL